MFSRLPIMLCSREASQRIRRRSKAKVPTQTKHNSFLKFTAFGAPREELLVITASHFLNPPFKAAPASCPDKPPGETVWRWGTSQ